MCTKDNDVGSACFYTCSARYHLTGGQTPRICQLSGDQAGWTGEEPTCTAHQCPPVITPPTHGVVSCTSSRDVDSACFYSCKTRYALQGGSRRRTCELSDGGALSWTGSKPRCRIEQCPSVPTAPANGSVSCNGRDVGSHCTFSCSYGYRLDGYSDTRTCILSGSSTIWTGSSVDCIPARCPVLPSRPLHGDVNCTHGQDFGSECTYSCMAGYELTGGSLTRNCTLYGNTEQWSGSSPRCTRIKCASTPRDPTYGHADCDRDTEIGSTCTFYCVLGFELSSNSTVTCTESGRTAEWVGIAPQCLSTGSIN